MPPLPVDLHPEAVVEAAEAREWYAQRSPTAALRFLNELDRGIAEIAQHPMRWPEHLHGTRKYRLHRFPFLLVYRVGGDRVQLIACQHGKRRPGYWRDRIS